MSSIADALKRAQQERERLRAGATAGAAPAEVEGAAEEPSLASVVLRKGAVEQGTTSGIPAVTPLTDAMRRAPVAAPPAVKAEQRAAETIVEDYTSKRRLNLPESMVVYHNRSGAVAEQYRKMRDNLMAGNGKREPQVLVVTSSVRGEGKTVTVMNLGLSLAEVRANRVLLIDGCVQRGGKGRSLSDLMRQQGEQGLAELLVAPEADAQRYLKATPWHNLWLLPAGARTTAEASAELLKSGSFRSLLRQLRSSFDWVLIDSPAALAYPDAGLLATPADGILLAVALHHTAREAAEATVRRLRSMNLAVRGCVVTRG